MDRFDCLKYEVDSAYDKKTDAIAADKMYDAVIEFIEGVDNVKKSNKIN